MYAGKFMLLQIFLATICDADITRANSTIRIRGPFLYTFAHAKLFVSGRNVHAYRGRFLGTSRLSSVLVSSTLELQLLLQLPSVSLTGSAVAERLLLSLSCSCDILLPSITASSESVDVPTLAESILNATGFLQCGSVRQIAIMHNCHSYLVVVYLSSVCLRYMYHLSACIVPCGVILVHCPKLPGLQKLLHVCTHSTVLLLDLRDGALPYYSI